MRAVVQRVSHSRVLVDEQCVGEIQAGFLVLLGVQQGDASADLHYLADKVANLRIMEDEAGKMNRSLSDVGGAMLVISQFTLLGDCRRGRRPSFMDAEDPARAADVFAQFCALVRGRGIHVETGVFGADMQVHLVNQGPVTILIDSRDRARQPLPAD